MDGDAPSTGGGLIVQIPRGLVGAEGGAGGSRSLNLRLAATFEALANPRPWASSCETKMSLSRRQFPADACPLCSPPHWGGHGSNPFAYDGLTLPKQVSPCIPSFFDPVFGEWTLRKPPYGILFGVNANS